MCVCTFSGEDRGRQSRPRESRTIVRDRGVVGGGGCAEGPLSAVRARDKIRGEKNRIILRRVYELLGKCRSRGDENCARDKVTKFMVAAADVAYDPREDDEDGGR